MPKNKRAIKISLTKTKKKPRESKDKLIEEIRGSCEKFSRLYLVEFENERNTFLQEVRKQLRPGIPSLHAMVTATPLENLCKKRGTSEYMEKRICQGRIAYDALDHLAVCAYRNRV